MDKAEVRAVIEYFYKNGMPPKEIHEDFIKTLEDESPSYSTVKKWAAELRDEGGGGGLLTVWVPQRGYYRQKR